MPGTHNSVPLPNVGKGFASVCESKNNVRCLKDLDSDDHEDDDEELVVVGFRVSSDDCISNFCLTLLGDESGGVMIDTPIEAYESADGQWMVPFVMRERCWMRIRRNVKFACEFADSSKHHNDCNSNVQVEPVFARMREYVQVCSKNNEWPR